MEWVNTKERLPEVDELWNEILDEVWTREIGIPLLRKRLINELKQHFTITRNPSSSPFTIKKKQ